jgi:hypothetical protein
MRCPLAGSVAPRIGGLALFLAAIAPDGPSSA